MTDERVYRILVVNDDFNPVGGAETIVANTIAELRKIGHDVFHLAFGNRNVRERRLRVIRDPAWDLLRYVSGATLHPVGLIALQRILNTFNPHIVHLHNIDKHILTILLPLKRHRVVRTILDYGIVCPALWGVHRDDMRVCDQGIGLKCLRHGCLTPVSYPTHAYLFSLKYFLQKRHVSTFMTATNRLKVFMEDAGFRNIDVMPYFSGKTADAAPAAARPTGKVLFVGRLEENKGCRILVEAMNTVAKIFPDVRLTIAGDGTERSSMEWLTSQLGLSHIIRFIGHVPESEVDTYYSESSLLVVPSIWMENSPVVIYDALALGLPVIATDRGGNAELVKHRENGLIVPPCNADALAEAILELIHNKPLLIAYGECSRRLSENVTKDRYFDRLQRVYRDLIETTPNGKNKALYN